MIGAKESSRPSFLGRERGPETFLETRKKCLACHFLQDKRRERGCGVCRSVQRMTFVLVTKLNRSIKRYHESFLVRSCQTVGPGKIESCVGSEAVPYVEKGLSEHAETFLY
jgi:hypothetical protein